MRPGSAPGGREDVERSTLALSHVQRWDLPWGGYWAWRSGVVVGTCAFSSPLDSDGVVEISYFTFPGHEGQGVASAMAAELLAIAFAAHARAVVAYTVPRENASTRVLLRLGFRRDGDGVDREIRQTWRWRLEAPERQLCGLPLGARTLIMGVVNVTPDSFSDGGRFLDASAAMAHGQALVRAGADLLDVGGESTRPGAAVVGVDEEIARVVPVIQGLRALGVPVSIDTSKPAVAAAALDSGARMVNDVTGLREGPGLAKLAAERRVPLCVMHSLGPPKDMKRDPRLGDEVAYRDLFGEVGDGLRRAVEIAIAAGVPRADIVIDPGIGFGKTYAHNLSLIRGLGWLRELGQPVLVGTSRKGFLGQLTGKPAPQRDVASAATLAIMAAAGAADIVRVHSVDESRDALAVGDAVFRASGR